MKKFARVARSNKCERMADLLSKDELAAELTAVARWLVADRRIGREFQFRDFAQALRFMNLVGRVAEEMNHHPDWSNSYGRVAIQLTTHSAGGLTLLDTTLARRIDEIAAAVLDEAG